MTAATEIERYMLSLINEERAMRGLDPLRLEVNLNSAAEDHSDWMLETDTFSHTGVDGSSATQRIASAGFDLSGSWSTAENIAITSIRGADSYFDEVDRLHDNLMNSDGHRVNLMNPDLDYIGIGIETGAFQFSSGLYDSVAVTQNFGATRGDIDLDPSESPSPLPTPSALPSRGDDSITGTDERDVINGRIGNDTIEAGAGNDRLRGHTGNDRLDGGAGDDRLLGGEGTDVFVFGTGHGRDVVTDYEQGIDRIHLDDTQRQMIETDGIEAYGRINAAGDIAVLRFGDDVLVLRGDEGLTLDALADDLLL